MHSKTWRTNKKLILYRGDFSMLRFQLSWVGVCRTFKMASKLDYKDVEESILQHLFSQCVSEERKKLKELFPELIDKLQNTMKDNDYYHKFVVED
jgi:hypothetical protein